MIDLYVYYKVREEHAPRLEPLVRAMQARLQVAHGVSVQLKRRPEARDGMQTWMEVYPGVAEAFGAVLVQAEREAGLAGLIEGPRRSEIFTDLTACA
jgi:Domain of unknown function (DUF4936)